VNTATGDRPLSTTEKLAYGAGDLGPAIMANVLIFFLLFFLTNVAGLPPGLAGWILAIAKISDAINDPIIGVMSDRTRSSWGRRYPWMAIGAVPLGVAFFLQWWVPFQDDWALFIYYLIISVAFNLAYTAVNLPYTALTPQLTADYNERTGLNSYRFAFSIGGSIGSLILAQVIFAQVADPNARYLLLGGICTVLSVIPIYLCIWGTFRRGMAGERSLDASEGAEQSLPVVAQVKLALKNRPFLFVIGIYLCSWLAVQLTASILPYFVTAWMGLPEAEFPKVALAVQGTALVMLFVWGRLSERLGKQGVYFAGACLWVVAQGGLLLLQPGQVGLMYGLAVLAGCGVATAYLVPWSMLPDTIDLDELNTGQRREGTFYAFMVFLQKLGLALALWLVSQAIEWAGYLESKPGMPVPVQPDSALWAIRIAVGPLPTVVLLIGVVLAVKYPITKAIHAEILLKLAERRSRPNP
jgi:GPH family glycoside/pentoside/hexuronide:cation symporter